MTRPSILIIDDEDICLLSMEMMLFGLDVDAKFILGGKQALEYLMSYPKVDLIFLDIMMPEINGLDLLKIIKKDPSLKNIPVVIQTGLRAESDLEKAYALGAANVLKKPYTKDMVLKEINKISK